MNQKAFQDLNLSDDFLFAKVMEDEAVLRPLVEKILGIHIQKMKVVQPQKVIDIEPDSKGIRLDIMADDEDGSLYDVEVQKRKEYNIGRRSRYYHSMMDLDLIAKGEEYQRLKKSIVIFICTVQPFEQSGRHRYVFEKRCIQETELALNDGVTTVILSARGEKDDIDPEMRAFLRYLENSSDEVAEESGSELVRRIHAKVCAVKQNRVREAEYMKLLERDRENQEKGRREGRAEGLRQGELLKTIQITRSVIQQGKPLDTLIQIAEEDTGMIETIAGLIRKNGKLTDEEILAQISGSETALQKSAR